MGVYVPLPLSAPSANKADFRYEYHRLITFATWVNAGFPSCIRLARSGVHNVGDCHVKCFACLKVSHVGNVSDILFDYDRLHEVVCLMRGGRQCFCRQNIPIEVSLPESSAHFEESLYKNGAKGLIGGFYPFSGDKAVLNGMWSKDEEFAEQQLWFRGQAKEHVHPDFQQLKARKSAIRDAKRAGTRGRIDKLAKAGFIPAKGGMFECFHCGLGLRFNPSTNPFSEHARWNPYCTFIIQVLGYKQTAEVVKETRRLAISSSDTRHEDVDGEKMDGTLKTGRKRKVEELVVD